MHDSSNIQRSWLIHETSITLFSFHSHLQNSHSISTHFMQIRRRDPSSFNHWSSMNLQRQKNKTRYGGSIQQNLSVCILQLHANVRMNGLWPSRIVYRPQHKRKSTASGEGLDTSIKRECSHTKKQDLRCDCQKKPFEISIWKWNGERIITATEWERKWERYTH